MLDFAGILTALLKGYLGWYLQFFFGGGGGGGGEVGGPVLLYLGPVLLF